MNLCQSHSEVGLNRVEVTNMIQIRMSCDSVSKYFDLRGPYAYNYDVKSECRYLDTLRNNGFKITKSMLEYFKWKKNGKWFHKFQNAVMVVDLKTKQLYIFFFTYVPNIDKWCLTTINKHRF